MIRSLLAAVLVTSLLPAAAEAAPAKVSDPVRYVDPLIGSANGGNTYRGAVRPFGMISWSPTNTAGDQTNAAGANGYSYNTAPTRGFALTHVNGAGCHPGAAGDIPIMPFAGAVTSSPTADTTDAIYASNFSHANETAKPGQYTVKLDSGAKANLAVSGSVTTGAFCGRRANGGTNNQKTYYRLYFVASFDHAFSTTGTWINDVLER